MKFTTDARTFARAIARVLPAIQARAAMPVLEHILVETDGDSVRLTGTDMDTRLTTTFAAEAEEPGTCLIPARRLADTIAALSGGRVQVSTGDARATIVTASGRFTLPVLSSGDFPLISAESTTVEFRITHDAYREMIEGVAFAVCADDFRPAMTGILMEVSAEKLTAVATDGFRLARRTVRIARDEGPAAESVDDLVLVPPKPLQQALRVMSGDVTITVGSSSAAITDGTTTLRARLIDEKYPAWRSVVPQINDNTLVLDRAALLTAVRRITLYANEVTHQIMLALGPDGVTVTGQDVDTASEAKEVVGAVYTGEAMTISFNGRFLADALERLQGDEVQLAMSTPLRPGLLTPTDTTREAMVLLMPIRILQ